MSEFDIAKKRQSMIADIATYKWRINGHFQEIFVMHERINRLQERLQHLDEFERSQPPPTPSHDELLRMCNTPCRRYRPRGA